MNGTARGPLVIALHTILALIVGLFVAAHFYPGTLNPIHDRISNYAAAAPWSGLITMCMVLLGLAYLLIAFGMVRHLRHNTVTALAAIFLSIGGSQLFLVALFPISLKRYEQTLRDRITGENVKHWMEQARAEHAQEIHNLTIGVAITCFVLALVMLAVGLRDEHPSVRRLSALLAGPVVLLFAMSNLHAAAPGLWQRLGFVLVLAWMALAGRRLLVPRAPGASPH